MRNVHTARSSQAAAHMVSSRLENWMDRLLGNEPWMARLIPLARAYLRYAPPWFGRRFLWTALVEPYFAWHSHDFVARTIFGARLAGNTGELLQQYVYYFGQWEPQLTRWIRRTLAPGDGFVDVGANIGYYSLLASTLVGDAGVVVAVEASPRIFAALEGNLARNGVRNVRTVSVAASDIRRRLALFRGPDTHIGLTTAVEAEGRAKGYPVECEVDAAPLAEILRPEEAGRARLIKIDAEGAEWSIVAGLEPLLGSSRPDLEVVVEINPECLAHLGRTPDDLVRLFAGYGFHPYCLENDYDPVTGYLAGREIPPLRLRAPLEDTTDVVFSRRDQETL